MELSKDPIDWHRECFKNFSASVAQKRKEVEQAAEELARSERELSFYAEQIAAAEERGLAAFDRDRLLINRRG